MSLAAARIDEGSYRARYYLRGAASGFAWQGVAL
jgi:hypothetical protein